MSIKKHIRKIAKFILSSQPEKRVEVNVAQINYNEILKGKNIVITGGSRGLGYYMARKFISEGANVIVSGRNEETLKKSSKELGVNCSYVVYDVINISESKSFLEKCMKMFKGKIDCLVCNAGVSLHENIYKNVSENGFDLQFNTNFKANYFLAKEYLEMKSKEKNVDASLLFISSETGNQCYDIPYGMTKAALNSLTRALSRREYKNGIRINAIAPGVTLTDMTSDYADAKDGNLYRNCASDRIFLPEEIAEVACFLLSDASKCISGEIIHCNAGNHLNPFWDEDIE